MGDRNRSFQNSNENQTQKIFKSVFVTNFPDDATARDLWKACNTYGTVVDVFIPFKRSKAGKRFAFVRFIKVFNLDRLVENLCTIWMGRFHLHANHVRFERPQKPNNPIPKGIYTEANKNSFASVLKNGHVPSVIPDPALVLDESCIKEHDFNLSLMGKVKDVSAIPNLSVIITKEGFQNVKVTYLGGMWVLFELDSIATKEKFLNHTGIGSWFTTIKQATNSFVNDERIVWVSIEGLPIKAWTSNSFRKIASLWGEFVEWEDSDSNSLSCKHLCLKTKMDVIINDKRKIIVQGKVFWIRAKELEAWVPNFQEDNQDDLSSDEEPQEADNIDEAREEEPQSEDPFNIYDILKEKKNNACNSGSEEPKYPPGFTPFINDQDKIVEENLQDANEGVQSLSNKPQDRKTNCGMSSLHSTYSRSQKSKVGGSILDLMDELVKVGQTMGYKMDRCVKDIESIIGSQGDFEGLWGNLFFDHVVGSSVGCSGGIVCVWDPNMFVKEHVSKSDYFVALMGTWTPTSTKLLIISVYAPQELTEKRDLWDYLHLLVNRWEGDTVIMGDFNEVHWEHERFGSVFNQQGAMVFNKFISSASLIDLPLDGYSFTWSHKSASKMSKLDRFLISEGLMELFPHLSAICLDKNLSDHRPILLRETSIDYGPSPFRFFHSWFTMEGFDSFVENTWKSLNIVEDNGLIRLKRKLQALKNAIKAWSKEARKKSNEKKFTIQHNLLELDKLIDHGSQQYALRLVVPSGTSSLRPVCYSPAYTPTGDFSVKSSRILIDDQFLPKADAQASRNSPLCFGGPISYEKKGLSKMGITWAMGLCFRLITRQIEAWNEENVVVFSCLACGTVEGQSEMRMRMVSSQSDRVVSGGELVMDGGKIQALVEDK
ncbi:RNA-directed DNA polymerase, eukaryota, Nucleotide-binding alpha-beta plait domain protein [Artemisia annua]|uniref:RNA-directed DNA polymerase, eukaryota, Nucleotide-binding alpha-beta plait domain protein n=1 Tax=Artemisia annua TaxID=35608 RepID=A0A2U1LPD7_ARTAN|nr:RNA-directed DNA polymerase, eukaryota, Nucleotide-binding alpha-beta plait domain protein [Artemisia annua]